MSYRVRRRATPLAPGERRDLERTVITALSPKAREALAVVLGELRLPPDAPWLDVPMVARLFESIAWLNLTAQAEQRGLTRWPAERWAAEQLRRNVRTLQWRRPVAGENPDRMMRATPHDGART